MNSYGSRGRKSETRLEGNERKKREKKETEGENAERIERGRKYEC